MDSQSQASQGPPGQASGSAELPEAAELRLLAAAFLGPPGHGLLEVLSRAAGSPGEAGSLVRELAPVLEAAPLAQLAENLAREHARLFGGIRPGYGLPPPYESVWRGEGRVMGTSAVAVSAAYASAGAELAADTGHPPDHVGIELGFLAYLCEQETEARAREDAPKADHLLAARRNFLDEHVLPWVPRLCEAIAGEDRSGFYQALAHVLLRYLTGTGTEGQ